jgi:hypothetical protein
MIDTKAGSITANEDRYMRWKSIDGTREDNREASFETLFKKQGKNDKTDNLLATISIHRAQSKQSFSTPIYGMSGFSESKFQFHYIRHENHLLAFFQITLTNIGGVKGKRELKVK